MNIDIKSLELEIDMLHERICSALSDTTRITILYLLADKAMYVNEICEMLDIPQSTVSRHLRVLRERNLVTTERQGTAIKYSLLDKRIIDALDILRNVLDDQIQAAAAITNTNPESK